MFLEGLIFIFQIKKKKKVYLPQKSRIKALPPIASHFSNIWPCFTFRVCTSAYALSLGNIEWLWHPLLSHKASLASMFFIPTYNLYLNILYYYTPLCLIRSLNRANYVYKTSTFGLNLPIIPNIICPLFLFCFQFWLPAIYSSWGFFFPLII